MAYAPNLAPTYSLGPITVGPAVLPAVAKTVLTDTSNAVRILAALADRRQVVQSLAVEVAISNTAAGKLLPFLYNPANTTAYQLPGVAHALLNATTTSEPAQIVFPYTTSAPLIVPETFELWLATMVAQPANSLIAYGTGKLF